MKNSVKEIELICAKDIIIFLVTLFYIISILT